MTTFFSGPRIGARAENVSPPTKGHRKSKKWSVGSGGTYLGFRFFLNEATLGAPRHVFITFHANILRSDLPMFNIIENITQN